MDITRRRILKASGAVLALATGLFHSARIFAQEQWNKAAFETKSFAATLKALGAAGSTESVQVQITAPDIAENGAVVPITVESAIPGTRTIAILIEKNPNTLSADFEIPEGTDPFITTRVKMAETSNIYAVVQAGGKTFHAAKEIKVTLGGCGG